MKQFKTIILTSLITIIIMIFGVSIYAKIIDLNIAEEKEIFIKDDLLETDFTKQIIMAKVINSAISEDKTNYNLSFSVPALIKNEDKSFSVEDIIQGVNVNLTEIYNGCRNSGQTKIECVAYIKELAVNDIKSVKQRTIDEANRLKAEKEKIDYLNEITDEDFKLTDEEINIK